MIKNAKLAKKMAMILLIIGGLVGVIAIALITINTTSFMTAVKEAVEGGQGTYKDIYEKYFVSNILVYALNILSIQGAISALSIFGGLMLLKSAKNEVSAETEEIAETIETTDEVENIETSETMGE